MEVIPSLGQILRQDHAVVFVIFKGMEDTIPVQHKDVTHPVPGLPLGIHAVGKPCALQNGRSPGMGACYAVFQGSQDLGPFVGAQKEPVAKGQNVQHASKADAAKGYACPEASAVVEGYVCTMGPCIVQHGIRCHKACQAVAGTAGVEPVGKDQVRMPKGHLAAALHLFCSLSDITRDTLIPGKVRPKLHGPSAPGYGHPGFVEADVQKAKIACRPEGCDHKDSLSVRAMLHQGIGPFALGSPVNLWPKIAVGVAPDNDVQPLHRSGKLDVALKTQVA